MREVRGEWWAAGAQAGLTVSYTVISLGHYTGLLLDTIVTTLDFS